MLSRAEPSTVPGMTALQPLDDDVPTVLTYRQALDEGLSAWELRGPLWRTPWRGVRAWNAAGVTPRLRAEAAALLLPGGGTSGAVGGWAAAHLLGGAEIDGIADDGRTRQPVTLYPMHRLRPRAGLVLRRSDLSEDDVVEVDGVRVTTPVRTAFDLGRWSSSVRDAVVNLDQVLRCLDLDLDDVITYANARPRWQGLPRLRATFPLTNPRARSRPESRLRLVWVLDAGLPEPMVNPEVRDASRALLGLPDLLDERTGLVAEYDGGQHRRLGAHTEDNAREERFERVGMTVVRATSLDQGPPLVARLRAGHADARSRPRGAWTAREQPLRR